MWHARIPGDLGLSQKSGPEVPGAFVLPSRSGPVTWSPASTSSATLIRVEPAQLDLAQIGGGITSLHLTSARDGQQASYGEFSFRTTIAKGDLAPFTAVRRARSAQLWVGATLSCSRKNFSLGPNRARAKLCTSRSAQSS